ncbi:MAG: hypothetical protein ACI8S2_001451, partial [Bacteroidia bacterium]
YAEHKGDYKKRISSLSFIEFVIRNEKNRNAKNYILLTRVL